MHPQKTVSLPKVRSLRTDVAHECTPPAHVQAHLPLLYWLHCFLFTPRGPRLLLRLFVRSIFSPIALMHQVTGEPLMRRSDDTADKLRSRLKAFHQQTQPVIDYYERAGKNVTIDAKQDKNVSGYVV